MGSGVLLLRMGSAGLAGRMPGPGTRGPDPEPRAPDRVRDLVAGPAMAARMSGDGGLDLIDRGHLDGPRRRDDMDGWAQPGAAGKDLG